MMTQQTGHPVFNAARIRSILDQGFDVIHYHNISLVGGPEILTYGLSVKLCTLHDRWLGCQTHMRFKYNCAESILSGLASPIELEGKGGASAAFCAACRLFFSVQCATLAETLRELVGMPFVSISRIRQRPEPLKNDEAELQEPEDMLGRNEASITEKAAALEECELELSRSRDVSSSHTACVPPGEIFPRPTGPPPPGGWGNVIEFLAAHGLHHRHLPRAA